MTKRPLPHRQYDIALTGDLDGYHVTMGRPTARELLDIRGGRIPDDQQLAVVARHVISHDFDVDDVLDLEDWVVVEILKAWGTALTEGAVPPETGGS